jgi:1-acyl-sn-glycerol-3-phosphate acyltransferase
MSLKTLRTPFLYPLIHFLVRCFFTLMGGYRVEGAEHVPASGPAIIAPNHVSMADPPLVAIAVPRTAKIMAKIELFRVPVIGPLIRHLGAFPVHRGTPDRAALRKAIDLLDEGWPVIIFPEGTRGDGKELGPLEKGVLLIASKSGAPIVPAYVSGTCHMLPRGAKRMRRSRVTVRFGPPLDPAKFGKGEDLSAAIMSGIAALKE